MARVIDFYVAEFVARGGHSAVPCYSVIFLVSQSYQRNMCYSAFADGLYKARKTEIRLFPAHVVTFRTNLSRILSTFFLFFS